MKKKASLALIEQVIMILVFAMAAALCLQAFALADRLSRKNEDRDRAVVLAQNAAEVCGAVGGDGVLLAGKLGGFAVAEGWTAFFGEDLRETSKEESAYRVEVTRQATECSGLGWARVCVYAAGDGKLLFELPVAWQEEAERCG